MKELFEFLLAPARLMPWRVATVFGAILGLELVANLPTWVGAATCFAAGLVGTSRGREFHQGILAAFAAILLANLILLMAGLRVIWAASSAGTSSASLVREATDLPLLGMILLGLPIGTAGAGIGAWLTHRRSVA